MPRSIRWHRYSQELSDKRIKLEKDGYVYKNDKRIAKWFDLFGPKPIRVWPPTLDNPAKLDLRLGKLYAERKQLSQEWYSLARILNKVGIAHHSVVIDDLVEREILCSTCKGSGKIYGIGVPLRVVYKDCKKCNGTGSLGKEFRPGEQWIEYDATNRYHATTYSFTTNVLEDSPDPPRNLKLGFLLYRHEWRSCRNNIRIKMFTEVLKAAIKRKLPQKISQDVVYEINLNERIYIYQACSIRAGYHTTVIADWRSLVWPWDYPIQHINM